MIQEAAAEPNLEPKVCVICSEEFSRPKGVGFKNWEKRECCSHSCAISFRWKNSGFNRTSVPIEERFWRFITKGKKSECWEWTGAQDGQGYGLISTRRNCTPAKAHTVSWIMNFGDIPEGLEICHACDNRICANPHHLMLGTRTANMVDASRKNRLTRK